MAVNPWLKKRLEKVGNPQTLSLIVEVQPEAVQDVDTRLREIRGVRVVRRAFSFIEVAAPAAAIPYIEAVPGVVMVSYNMPRRIMSFLRSITDPLVGKFSIDDIIVPPKLVGPDLLLPFSPLRFLRSRGPLGEVTIIPTIQSRRLVRDVQSELAGKGVTLAVLDTGWSPQTQILRCKALSECSTDPTPIDGHGHGSWCTSAAGGTRANGMFGSCEGVAPMADLIHVKVLHGLLGFGTQMDIIAGMRRAVEEGARVLSMSLGGDECQGGCDNCPECRAVKTIAERGVFTVIASGNAGPGEWTIGCPGCAPDGISVGSISMTDAPDPAWFSSRGPSNLANQGRSLTSKWLKPDVLAPGGGRSTQEGSPDEVLYSGEYGILAGMYTGVKEPLGFGAMHGTCVAADTLIYTPDGPVEITSLRPGSTVYSFNGGATVKVCRAVLDQGPAPVYELRTRRHKIRATANHPFLFLKEEGIPRQEGRYSLVWKELKDIRAGDVVVASRSLPENVEPELDKLLDTDMLRLLGYFAGDGWVTYKRTPRSRNYTVALADSSGEEINDYLRLFEIFGGRKPGYSTSGRWYRIDSKRLALILALLGLHERHVVAHMPAWLFHLSREKKLGFLKGYLDADGSNPNSNNYRLEVRSEEMLRGIQALARYAGVPAGTIRSRERLTKAPNSKRPSLATTYQLSIGTREAPKGLSYVEESRQGRSLFDERYFALTKVTSIKKAGIERVYDIEVEGTHNFMAEGLVIHNSQATPHVAGLVACLLEGGLISTVEDFKRICAAKGQAKTNDSGWGLVKLSWFG